MKRIKNNKRSLVGKTTDKGVATKLLTVMNLKVPTLKITYLTDMVLACFIYANKTNVSDKV